jgi:SAM-dependent methyltransferase
VFHVGEVVLRGLTSRGLEDWEAFLASGLPPRLAGDVVETELAGSEELETLRALEPDGNWFAALRHERIPFVSYPYEWSFSMLRDAALLQLRLTRDCFAAGLSTKDATPYNVQWRGSRPVFIDVGSFQQARAGEPWLGYRQFCMQFLYPLLFESYKGMPFQPWLRGSLEGIDPASARSVLGGWGALRPGVLKHVVLHARLERSHGDDTNVRRELRDAGFDARLVDANLRQLHKLVQGLRPPGDGSEWSDYGTTCAYTAQDTAAKEEFVRTVVRQRPRDLVWDLGCNDGRYSRIAAEGSAYTVALDADRVVIDRLYNALKAEAVSNVLPLIADVADPSPGLGWQNRERPPIADRGRPDLCLCLALVHHLAIGRMIPLDALVGWLADLGGELVVEFPHRDDEMVRRLLARKAEGAHPDYTRADFEAALRSRFEIHQVVDLPSGTRTMYHASPV